MKQFFNRLWMGILLLLGLLLVIFGPKISVLFVSVLVTSLGLWELFAAFQKGGMQPDWFSAMLANLFLQYAAYGNWPDWELFVVMLFVIFLLLLLTFDPSRKLQDIFATAFGFLYVSGLFSFVLRLGSLHQSLLFLVFLASWGTDTCAYCFGTLFGRTKLYPSITPKKTVEGAVGGIAGALFLSALLRWLFFPSFPLAKALIIVGVGSVFSQVGDLCASQFKRRVGIKDYSHLFGDHGGVLDRFDSVLFAAPVVWMMLHLI